MIGISNTLGRVLAGWVSDFSWVSNFPFEICTVIPFSITTIHLDLPIAVSNDMITLSPLIVGFHCFPHEPYFSCSSFIFLINHKFICLSAQVNSLVMTNSAIILSAITVCSCDPLLYFEFKQIMQLLEMATLCFTHHES